MENNFQQDNYETNFDPCRTCRHNHQSNSVSPWTSVLAGILLIVVCGSVYLWNELQSAEAKLQNCLYIDESGSLHSVKNGQDWNMLDADYLKNIVQNPDILDEDY